MAVIAQERISRHGFTYDVARIRLTGASPILMSNPMAMGSSRGVTSRIRTIPEPADEAASRLYRMATGQLYVPAMAVRAALLNGGRNHRMDKVTMWNALAAGVLFEPEDYLPLWRGDEPIVDAMDAPNGWTVNVARAVVQKSGVLRARPQINLPWSLEFTILFDIGGSGWGALDRAIMPSFQRAGQMVGLLDWRPAKSGMYGRFHPELI